MSRIRLSTIKDITDQLDSVANEIQATDPVAALALDRVADKLENRIAVTDLCWKCGEIIRGFPYKTKTLHSHDICEKCFNTYNFVDKPNHKIEIVPKT